MNLLSLLSTLGSKEMGMVTTVLALLERFKQSPTRDTFFSICAESGIDAPEAEILYSAMAILVRRYSNANSVK